MRTGSADKTTEVTEDTERHATFNERENDLSRQIWRRKERAIRGALTRGVKMHIVAPSKWLADCARESSLFRNLPVSVIPYGVETDVFRPMDPQGIRESLGFGPDDRVVMFVADYVDDPRKGMTHLLRAFRSMIAIMPNVRLLCVGAKASDVEFDDLPVVHTGTIRQDWLMALLYNAADIFVIPSLQDNLPNTVLEAMACGTPVVGFDVGGIPDMVRPRETGVLAPVGDAQALGEAITTLCEDDGVRELMSVRCREVVLAEYTLARQAKAYINLYDEMAGRAV